MSEAQRYRDLVSTVVSLLEARNPFNLDHCNLVAHYADAIAVRVRLDETARERLRTAAQLHTLGVLLQLEEKKPAASLPILGKDLTAARSMPAHQREEAILRTILAGVPGLEDSLPIIVHRHEWFDGSGSLLGQSGQDISVEARILSVADAFVDLATPKSHRDPVTLTEVLKRLREGAGTQFDPRYVDELSRSVLEEEQRWGASARARRLEIARCRHWLGLGHFYRQSRDTEWSLRCYRAAETLADGIGEGDLLLECVSGQFQVFCDTHEIERAHQTLARVRSRAQAATGWSRQWYLLQWGLLEWQRGNETNGEQIVQGVLDELGGARNISGEAAALAVLSHMALMRRGAHDETHVRLLSDFLRHIAAHDLFDVLVSYRPQTIPLLLSALVHDREAALARNLLTRMGEPCPGKLVSQLAVTPPARWLEVLHPGATPPSAPASPVPAAPVAASEPAEAAAPPVSPLRFLGLGSFRLECAGQVVTEDDWPTQKAMKLFAYLTTRRGTSASDQSLMEMFWPLVDEDKARNSLRNAVHQVRSVLRGLLGDSTAAEVLTRSRRTGTLTVQLDAFVDFEVLEKAVRDSSQLITQGRHTAAIQLLKEAVALYRGSFMESVRDDWATALRSRLSELHLRALDLLARTHLAQGDAESAELIARRALSCDDLQEEGHVNLVEALAAQGRHTDALRHHQQAAAHFKREMGLDAPSRLTATYERLLRQGAATA